MKKMLSSTFINLLCLLLVITSLLTIDAQINAQSFVVTPTMVELEVFPGEEKNFSLRVINASTQEQSIRLYLRDIMLEENGNLKFPPAASSKWSCTSWVRIEPSLVTLPPQHGTEIACKLLCPRGETGGRYAAIIVEPAQKSPLPQERIAPKIRYRIAVLILLTVHGGRLEEKALISEINFNPQGEEEKKITVCVKNEGNIHIIGKGQVVIKDRNGRKWTEVNLEAGRGIILPESERNFKGVLNDLPPPGEYIFEAEIKYRRTDRWKEFMVKKQEPHTIEEASVTSPVEGVVNFSVQPSSLNINLPPNARRFFVFDIISREEVPLEAEAILEEPEDSSQSCDKWIKVNPQKLSIPPNQTGKLRVSLNVPAEAEGKYSAKLVIRTSLQSSQKDKVKGVAEINIVVSVPG